jgi:hypothetical protein
VMAWERDQQEKERVKRMRESFSGFELEGEF